MSNTMLEKVRKLLAKAEDPGCTPDEAAALNDKAAELIAKYGVDQALLAARSPEADAVGDRMIDVVAPYALDKAGLLGTVASALRCRSVRRKEWHRSAYGYSVHLFGFAADLDRTELLYTSLLVQASYGLAAAQVPVWETPAAFRRSWLVGFTQAVGARLRAAERRAEQEAERYANATRKRAAQQADASAGGAPGNSGPDNSGPDNGGPGDGAPCASGSNPALAVVLADRSAQVDRRLAEAYPRLGTAQPRRLMGSGRAGGYAAGQRADLGAARLRPATARGIASR